MNPVTVIATTEFDFSTGSAVYTLVALPESAAEHFGCSGATHILHSRRGNGYTIGTAETAPGPAQPISGWARTRRGYPTTFTPWGAPETGAPISGWIGE